MEVNLNLHKTQYEVLKDKHRYKVLVAGRRWGKTTLAAYMAVLKGLKGKKLIWVVAPTYPQSNILRRKIFDYFYSTGLIKEDHKAEKYITLINGAEIWFKSADRPDNLRGEGIDFLIIDEAAQIKEDVWRGILRPTLMDTGGDVLFISTPKGKNWFYEEYLKGLDGEGEYKSFHFSSWQNPFIPRNELELAKSEMPERLYKQEIMAEFLDEQSSVFRGYTEIIKSPEEKDLKGNNFIIGVDLAKHEDFTVLTALNADTMQVVEIWRFNNLSWAIQKARIKAMAEKYKNARIVMDATGIGDPIYDDLYTEGLNIIPYKFTNQSKARLIENLAVLIENRNIFILPNDTLLNELSIFEYQQSKTGVTRYSAPEGYHDDCVISLALAAWGATHYRKVDYILSLS